MAAEYEVNIKLNTKQIDAELKSIDRTTKNIGKGIKRTIDPSVKKLQAQGLALRRLAKSINPLLRQADKVVAGLAKQADVTSRKFLPSAKDLNAAGRGIKRLTTEKEKQAKLDVRAEQGMARRARKIREINRLEQEGNKARARFLAGAPIPGLVPGQTVGPARPPVQGAASPIGGTEGIPGSPAFNRALEIGRFRSSPIRGSATTPGSPLAIQRGMNRLGQVGLGAGFPLLFGGGAGSVIGGGLGGLTGSFGAQIAFSAAGQQIDQLIGRTIASAESLGSVGTALDFLRERSLFSSKESEELARKLENQGDLTGIAALVTEELNEALGPDGIQKMQDLAEQTRLAKDQWGQLATNLELLISGPLAQFLSLVNQTLGVKVAQSNFARTFREMQEKDPERLMNMMPFFEGSKNKIVEGLSVAAFGPNAVGMFGKTPPFDMQGMSVDALISFTEQMRARLNEMGPLAKGPPITEEDKERFRVKRTRIKKDKLPGLEAERSKLERLLDLEEQRFSLQLKGDDAGILRLQAREKLARIAEEIAKIKASDLTAEQKTVALQIQGIENSRVNLELGYKLAELENERQEKFEDSIKDLDHQLALARATTEEERERLRIEEAIRQLREKDKLSEPQLAQIKLRMEALAEEKNLINTFIKETREQIEKLSNPMFQMISLATTLGDAFSQSFRGILNGSMSAQQALANLFQRTADHFLDMAAQMIAAQIRMQAVNLFMNILGGSSGGGGGGTTPPTTMPDGVGAIAANGLAFNRNGVIPFAKGGVVNKPTLFPFANGTGLMGEAGPEAIMPLRRGPSGRLGVEALGGGAGATSIVVNVDASGSSVEGNADQASQLGKAIGIAVQQELVKQKRPGGLLAS